MGVKLLVNEELLVEVEVVHLGMKENLQEGKACQAEEEVDLLEGEACRGEEGVGLLGREVVVAVQLVMVVTI